jgi:cysteinyl-tRNA synthetase
MNNLWIKTLKFNELSIQWFTSLCSLSSLSQTLALYGSGDRLREQLKMMGVTLVDLPDGQTQWYPTEKSHNQD